MHYIEQDFRTLKYYCKSLGLTVKVLPAKKSTDQSAEYIMSEKTINLYNFKSQSKTFMLLCLLHETAHHREFLDKNEKDSELLISAMLADNPNKAQRMALYISESNAALYMIVIHNELKLKIPKYKVEAEAALDTWIAKQFYETGKTPTRAQNIKKRREFRDKFKNNI